ncbi:MAG: hypothetical protein ACK4NR_03480 [Micavibrio sp.]
MVPRNVTDSAMKGYELVWRERKYLFQLAVFPLFIKIVCVMTIITNGLEFDTEKRALLMLPSFLADGWVMSHLIRLIYLDQRWPFRPTGQPQRDAAILQDRARGIMAGTICFTLIEFLKEGFLGIMQHIIMPDGTMPQHPATAETAAEPSTLAMVLALGLTAFTFWSVRYLWLYIPAAAGFSGREYLRRCGSMMGSIRLLGAWMICSIPVLCLSFLVMGIFLGPFVGPEGLPAGLSFIKHLIFITANMVALLLSTAGLSFVIRDMFVNNHKQSS